MALTKRMQAVLGEKRRNRELPLEDCVRRARYSPGRIPQQSWSLRANGEFKAAWDALEAEPPRSAGRELTREEVVKDLDDIADICTQAGAGSWQVSARLKAVELKAKILGMLSENAAKVQLNQQINNQTPENITVRFIAADQSDIERKQLNASAAQFEANTGMLPGSMGRLPDGGEVLAPEVPLKPVTLPAKTASDNAAYDPLAPQGYCSWARHGAYQGEECPKCKAEGKRELHLGPIPGTPEWGAN